MRVLLDKTTSAAASDGVQCGSKLYGEVTFSAFPTLAGVEVATLQKLNPDGNWTDSYDSTALVQLTATHTEVTVYGQGFYRMNKASTTGATGIFVETELGA